ncbi:PLP-dependent transferase [Hypoxylon sp. FL1857]|nr:PLP-dependent transferase [Hypoxylon sp. FL1857]
MKKDISNIELKLDITNRPLNYPKGNPTAVHAKGIYIYTEDGREILDAASGAAVVNVSKFCEKLVASTNGLMYKCYLTGSGSDATEAALKLARQYYYDKEGDKTSRDHVISRDRSYHGNTLGALSVSEFTISHVSSCYSYRQQLEVAELEEKFIEPVVGAALGCAPYVPGYLTAMLEVCHKYDILCIFDEVMCEEEGVAPDIQIMALLISEKVYVELKNEQFIHGLTYDCMPVAAVAGLTVHRIIEDDNLLENVTKQGEYLIKSLKNKLGDHQNIGDIRGKGLLICIEFVDNKDSKEPFNPELGVAHKIADLAFSPPNNKTVYPDVEYIVNTISIVIEKAFKEINSADFEKKK